MAGESKVAGTDLLVTKQAHRGFHASHFFRRQSSRASASLAKPHRIAFSSAQEALADEGGGELHEEGLFGLPAMGLRQCPDQATPGNRLVVVATEHSDRFHECIESSVEVRYLCLQIVKVFSTCGLV